MRDYDKLLGGWQEGMTKDDEVELAYAERNMLALMICKIYSEFAMFADVKGGYDSPYAAGWYYDTDNDWDGWKRVLSIEGGRITFHIPDDFDIGNVPEIKPNWDGHTTKEKWDYAKKMCGCKGEGTCM